MISKNTLENAYRLHKSGKHAEACLIYEEVLNIYPENPRALYLRGMLALQEHDLQLSEKCLRRALKHTGGDKNGDILSGLGQVLYFKGDGVGALDYWVKAHKLDPGNGDTAYNIGTIELERHNWNVAEQYLKIAKDNGFTDTSLEINLAQVQLGRKNYTNATDIYKNIIDKEPNNVSLWSSLAHALNLSNKPQDSAEALKQALTLNSTFAPAYLNLSNCKMLLADVDGAIEALNQGLLIDNTVEDIYHKKLFFSHYQFNADAETLYKLHSEWGTMFSAQINKKIEAPFKHQYRNRDVLKVGYVSSDFCNHSVGIFMEPLIAAHDKSRFDITCYSGVTNPDDITVTIKKESQRWHNIASLSDEEVAKIIYNDDINILVDLSGHTSGNRLGVFARKPAPVQISYLGYPGTVGLPEIEYRIADNYSEPPSIERYSAEKVVRLSNGFHCLPNVGVSVPIGPPPVLRNIYITFGSFNNIAKVNDRVVLVWSKILSDLPNAKLILKNSCFRHKQVCNKFLMAFAKHGINVTRIELRDSAKTRALHLNQYNDIDIALDPFPYNGTTTTCEALWMGVPVIGILRDKEKTRHDERIGLSLLTQIGLPDFVTNSEASYVSIAKSVSKDVARLTIMRKNLRENFKNSSLARIEPFMRDLENAYLYAWKNKATHLTDN